MDEKHIAFLGYDLSIRKLGAGAGGAFTAKPFKNIGIFMRMLIFD
jgi:hypothetical protein